MEIVQAYGDVQTQTQKLKTVLDELEMHFQGVFTEMEKKAAVAKSEIRIPRICGRQTLRNNYAADSPEQYYRATVFQPYLTCLISEMEHRFSTFSQIAAKALFLIPSNAETLRHHPDLADTLNEFYHDDIPNSTNLGEEIKRWIILWEDVEKAARPQTIPETLLCSLLQHKKGCYPNIIQILRLLLILPVTSATVERSNSALAFIKSARRSTMKEDRLNVLLILFTQKDLVVNLNLDSVVSRFARNHPRRMALCFPLKE